MSCTGLIASTHAQVKVCCGAEALQLALERVSSLIVGLCQAGRAVHAPELALLAQLVASLQAYNDGQDAHHLCR